MNRVCLSVKGTVPEVIRFSSFFLCLKIVMVSGTSENFRSLR